jgi:hypothetical protein
VKKPVLRQWPVRSGGFMFLPTASGHRYAALARVAALPAAIAAGCVISMTFAGAAFAQGRLEAKYEASLAGIPVGRGSWSIEIGDDQYTATATGGSSGLLNAFVGGSGSSSAQGRLVAGTMSPQAYTATTVSSKKSETTRMVLSGGVVKESRIEPEPPIDGNRIVVTEAHRRNVLDPMTGSLLRVAGTTDLIAADACRTTIPVFDGRMRYDLKLEFKRIETIRADRGYRGAVVVCGVLFQPIAGYIPERSAIKYLVAQRNMEAWFAPIAGTRVLAPYRVTIPTPLGTAMLEATQFVTTASPPRTSARTQ